MIRGLAGQPIGRQLTAIDGTPFTGQATVHLVGDNGPQTLGATGAGLCTHKGLGYHSYVLSAVDIDFRQVGFTFTGPGCLSAGLEYETITDAQNAALQAASATNAYTVRDQLRDALMEIGVVGPADDLDPEIYAVAHRRLLGMYSTFQAMRLVLFSVERDIYTLIPGQQVYTIGDGGDFDGTRPIFLSGSEILPEGEDFCLPFVPYTHRSEWFNEPLKDLTDLYPRRFLYEATYPLGTITVWPVPTTAAQVAIATPSPLSSPSSLDTTLVYSPGYDEAWLYNLAKRLVRPMAAKLTAQEKAELASDARDSLGLIKRLNDDAPPRSRSDAAVVGRMGYDIRSNQYR